MADFVTVICRLPSGVVLDLHDLGSLKSRSESGRASGKSVAPLRSVVLNGQKADPTYHPAEGRLLGRAGRTQVDADFWKAWLDQNKNSTLVKQKLVFAEANLGRAEAAIQELRNEKTGLEGVDENSLPKDVSKSGKN